MTVVLDTGIETLEATDGRSFFVPAPEIAPTLGNQERLAACFESLREEAYTALTTLEHIERLRALKTTNVMIPTLLSPQVVEEATFDFMDQLSVWSRQTDSLAGVIARDFPNQTVMNNEDLLLVSDGCKLYQVNTDLSVRVYSSFIAQSEMNVGVQLATEEMWQDLLTRIVVTH